MLVTHAYRGIWSTLFWFCCIVIVVEKVVDPRSLHSCTIHSRGHGVILSYFSSHSAFYPHISSQLQDACIWIDKQISVLLRRVITSLVCSVTVSCILAPLHDYMTVLSHYLTACYHSLRLSHRCSTTAEQSYTIRLFFIQVASTFSMSGYTSPWLYFASGMLFWLCVCKNLPSSCRSVASFFAATAQSLWASESPYLYSTAPLNHSMDDLYRRE